VPVIPISAERGEGIEQLTEQLRRWLAEAAEQQDAERNAANLAPAAD
jgi:predicted GTPase